jgi:type III restriction enzyme
MCLDPQLGKNVEEKAQETVQKWLKRHRAAISALHEAQQQGYDEIRRLAGKPEISPLNFPSSVEGKRADKSWPRHLYTTDKGTYPAKFNTWETRVLKEELAKEDVVAWLRVVDRKPWALCVPYQYNGEWLPLYPDFLFVRKEDGHLVVDLLDPHLIELADAPAKAAGLAQYAAEHAHKFGRIELIIVEDDEPKRLDLTNEKTRDRVKAVKTHEHLRQLFEQA